MFVALTILPILTYYNISILFFYYFSLTLIWCDSLQIIVYNCQSTVVSWGTGPKYRTRRQLSKNKKYFNNCYSENQSHTSRGKNVLFSNKSNPHLTKRYFLNLKFRSQRAQVLTAWNITNWQGTKRHKSLIPIPLLESSLPLLRDLTRKSIKTRHFEGRPNSWNAHGGVEEGWGRRGARGDEREDTREQTTRKCFHYSRIKAPPPPSQLVDFKRGKRRTGRWVEKRHINV